MNQQLIAEARRRVPSLSDQQWATWLEYVEAHNGVLTLAFDGTGCFAIYPTPTPWRPLHASAMDQSE